MVETQDCCVKSDCNYYYTVYEFSNMGIRESPNCLRKNFSCLGCEDYEKDEEVTCIIQKN